MGELRNSISNMSNGALAKGQSFLDRMFPPDKREEWKSSLQAFIASNPKLSAFLLTNLVLTGLPLLFFTAFSIMVFVSSIVVCILLGLFVALLFTTFCVGVGLLFLLPTLFMATMTATFVFTWGLCGYYILTWFNERRRPVDKGGPLDKRLNNRTKGRLSYITGNLNGSGASESNSTFQDNPPVNGDTEAKKQSHVPNDAAKPGEMQDAMEQAWGATSKGGGATGTAAGTEGSTTVLT